MLWSGAGWHLFTWTRLARWGGGQAEPEPSTRLALVGGMGLSRAENVSWLRPELVLSLDRQDIAEPVPGLLLPQSGRLVIDLSIAALVEPGGTHLGGEVGLAIRHGLVGGVYARAGLVMFDDRPLFTWNAGLTLGTYPSILAGLGALLVGVLVLSVTEAAADGLRDVLGG